jgi:hypothetical protein
MCSHKASERVESPFKLALVFILLPMQHVLIVEKLRNNDKQ